MDGASGARLLSRASFPAHRVRVRRVRDGARGSSPGSTWACRSPSTPPRSTWCWRGGRGRAPSSSRRSPRLTGPCLPFRHSRTSGGTTSTSKCRLMTGGPTPRHPAQRSEHPMRSRRPRSPGRARSPTEQRWMPARPLPCRDELPIVLWGQCPLLPAADLGATSQPGHAGAVRERPALDGSMQAAGGRDLRRPQANRMATDQAGRERAWPCQGPA